MKQVAAALLLLIASPFGAEAEGALDQPPCRQCLVVTSESWSANHGTLTFFERASATGDWRRLESFPVMLGRAGMAPDPKLALAGVPAKREGDVKAPAGNFPLRRVFGYAPTAETRMPYLALSPTVLGIDDPRSRYYNRVIDRSRVTDPDWHSAEVMRRDDIRYKWGVLVDYNVPPRAGAGSCIFLHVWLAPHVATVGCTAMAEPNMLRLIRWLDPEKHPRLVQMPASLYPEFQPKWNLPNL
jgi:D-alanyl-D-alanine dipeptidase